MFLDSWYPNISAS